MMYRDVFVQNQILKKYLMLACVSVYADSEKTEYYGKFSYRFFSASVMEYLFNEPDYRKSFQDLVQRPPQVFTEFLNLMINDLNS